jgi:hypothetical protein
MRTWAAWTTGELRRLSAMHEGRQPPLKELCASFPRHTSEAIRNAARRLDLRHQECRWLAIAHLHFVRREAEMRI